MFMSPARMILSYLPNILLRLHEISSKNSSLSVFGGRYYFFLTMVNSRHIVLAFFVSKFFVCFAIKPSQTKTIFPRPLDFQSLLRGGN